MYYNLLILLISNFLFFIPCFIFLLVLLWLDLRNKEKNYCTLIYAKIYSIIYYQYNKYMIYIIIAI